MPAQIQVRLQEKLCEALLHVPCAFVNAISYRAEIFVIELYGTEIRKRLKAELVFMQCSIECDVERLAGAVPSKTSVTTRSRENRHVKTVVEM